MSFTPRSPRPDLTTLDALDHRGVSAHVRLESVTLSRGARRVLHDLCLTVAAGDRLAVVGENGRGKSSLLHVITGDLAPDHGRVHRSGSLTMVAQTLVADDGRTVGDLLGAATRDSDAALAALDAAAEGLARGAAGAEDAYATALESATRLDAWDAGRRLDVALVALAACTDRERRLASLSVGQRYRVRLACALGARQDLLLLDEPTNHLDAAGLAHLTGALRDHPGAVVLVSHDRALLREVGTTFLDLDPSVDGRARTYAGGYDAWVAGAQGALRTWRETYAAEVEAHRELAQAAEDARGRLSTGWRPDKGTGKHQRQARTAGVVQAFRRRQEALEAHRVSVPPPPASRRWPRLPTHGGQALRLASGGVPGRLRPVEVSLAGGEHRVVSGPNGAGKTTLLRLLAGELPDPGRHVAAGVRIGHLGQETPRWPDGTTGLRRLEAVPGRARAVGLVGAAELSTPVERLSEGQRRRLNLELVLATRPHVLLLDEPTNHLSPALVDELAAALRDPAGLGGAAVVLATHDRQLLADLAGWERIEL